MSSRYTALPSPNITPEEIQTRLDEMQRRIAELMHKVEDLEHSLFQVTSVAPSKLVEGMIRFADGTLWNPGSGRGLYQYVSGAWVKL